MRTRDLSNLADLRSWLDNFQRKPGFIALPGEHIDAGVSLIMEGGGSGWRVYDREPGRGDNIKDIYRGASEADACQALARTALQDLTNYGRPLRDHLEEALTLRRCPSGAYCLAGEPVANTMVLEPRDTEWRVFFWTGADEQEVHLFKNERAACAYLWGAILVRNQI